MLRSIAPASAAVLLVLSAAAQVTALNSSDGAPLSPRVVSYAIDARLSAGAKRLDAEEVVDYRNDSGQPLSVFPFHLYLNAFQPGSTYSQELRRNGGDAEAPYSEDESGSIRVAGISAEGYGDLTPSVRFPAPDDGNPADRTVMEVTLPAPLQPGGVIRFHVGFQDQLPRSPADYGREREIVLGSHWFPQMGVFWRGQWNCRPYHAGAEFFSDFAAYTIRLTLPQDFVVGSSGIETGERFRSDGTKTVSFRGEDISDFAWVASPHFVAAQDRFQNSLGTVKLRILILKTHVNRLQRLVSILKRSMQTFDEWYGPYPYREITLVDSETGGKAYPAFIAAGTGWWAPRWSYQDPEAEVVHQVAWQYWHGMIAPNPSEAPELEEGLEGYSEGKVMDALFGRQTSFLNAATVHASDLEMQRAAYLGAPGYKPWISLAWMLLTGSRNPPDSSRAAVSLTMLQSLVGEDTLRRAMRIYFTRYRFTQPTGLDFLHTVEEASGRNDLEPFFRQAIYGTETLDYSLDSLTSDAKQWWKGGNAGGGYHTEALVHRIGDFVFPVTVEVAFADGSKERSAWDGAGRWMRFTWDKPAPAVYAQVDPDGAMSLDADRFNNSYILQSHPGARFKLTNYWVFAQQLFAQWVSFLV